MNAGSAARLIVGVSVALSACSAGYYERVADDRNNAVLAEGDSILADRADQVILPEEKPPEDEEDVDTDATDVDIGPAIEPRYLSLLECLAIAIRGNRGYQTETESLYLVAQSLVGTRFQFSPQLSLVLSYAFQDGSDVDTTHDAGASFSLSQIVPSGGTFSTTINSGYFNSTDPVIGTLVDNAGTVQFMQPILRGAGYEVSHADLIQAERDLIYAVRAFELFREDFSIDVARRFYELVRQKQSIENARQNLDGLVFGRRQSEALFEVGRSNELDVLRARRNEFESRNSLLQAVQNYRLDLDRFKIFLGLDTTANIDVAPEEPDFVPVRFDVDSAVDVALQNRLDLITERQRLEDAARDVRVAKNGLLPDLDLTLAYSRIAEPDSTADLGFDSDLLQAGFNFEIPLQRVNERNAYRSAQIGQRRAKRGFEQFRDELIVEVKNAFLELERRVKSLEIQRRLIEDQEKNVRIARLRFERGEVPNRDIVEAQQSLLDAQNSLISEKVDYEIDRLRLLRNLGILFIDEQGVWSTP